MNHLCVTIVSRHNCHLCHVVHRVAEQVRQELVFDLVEMDVDSDPRLVAQYGDQVPREAINKARWRNPISRILSRVKLALTRG